MGNDNIKFISNNLNKEIVTLLKESENIIVITAFIKKSGIDFLEDVPHKNISIICGIDFNISDPEAILAYEQKIKSIKIFFNPKSTFHPKCYYIKGKNEYLVVGSSNLTAGGLETNYETSVLVKKDYSTEDVFKNFLKYYKGLNDSEYIFDTKSALFAEYKKRYDQDKPNTDHMSSFLEEFIKTKGYSKIDSTTIFNIDDWISDKDGRFGTIISKKNNIITCVFLDGKKENYKNLNYFFKLVTFSNNLTEKYISSEKLKFLENKKLEFYSQIKEWYKNRELFYKRWEPTLKTEMSEEQIKLFFEDLSSVFGSLYNAKKNKIIGNKDKFNEYLKMLQDESLSLYYRYEEGVKSLDGISDGVTSIILSIFFKDIVPVFNDPSKKFIKFLKVDFGKKTQNYTFTQYRFISLILKDKFKFKNLLEFDCFVGSMRNSLEDV